MHFKFVMPGHMWPRSRRRHRKPRDAESRALAEMVREATYKQLEAGIKSDVALLLANKLAPEEQATVQAKDLKYMRERQLHLGFGMMWDLQPLLGWMLVFALRVGPCLSSSFPSTRRPDVSHKCKAVCLCSVHPCCKERANVRGGLDGSILLHHCIARVFGL